MEKPSREQILSEPAGERLDAWVAEFVMGWTPDKIENSSGDLVWSGYRMPNGAPNMPAHRFSTDIARAWEVVEKLAEDHQSVAVYRHFDEWLVGTVWLWPNWNPARTLYAGKLKRAPRANTAPLAICRAALLSVLDEE